MLLIEPLQASHQQAFIEAVRASRELHQPWVYPPDSVDEFLRYLEKPAATHIKTVLKLASGELVGVVNISEIVRGGFQSAYLGYYAFVPHQNKGLMREGLSQVIGEAFGKHGLHRLEANIQPANSASIKLTKSLGFRHEGFSPRYLKINGEWRDHERFAITAEEWDELNLNELKRAVKNRAAKKFENLL